MTDPEGKVPAAKSKTVSHTDHDVRDPQICGGQPVTKGTRVLVRVILACLAHVETTETILREFPSITDADVRAIIAFASASANEYDLPQETPCT